MLLRVSAPHYVAGLIIQNGICTEAAPILHWAVGKPAAYLGAYFKRKQYEAKVVKYPKE